MTVDVPGLAAQLRRGVVLVPLEPELRETGDDAIGDRTLLPRGAGERAQLQEEVDDRRCQRLLHASHPMEHESRDPDQVRPTPGVIVV